MEIILQVKKNCIIDSFRCFAFTQRIKNKYMYYFEKGCAP